MPIAHSSEKRQSILKSATALFLEQGFQKASMERIALNAPVSKATLYKYFDSKNELLAAVISELSLILIETMNDVSMDTGSVENNLKKIAIVFVDLIYSAEALAIYRLVISECHAFPELGELVYNSGPQAAIELLDNFLKEANKEAQLSVVNTQFSAEAFFSLLKGDFHFRCLVGMEPVPSRQKKDEYTDKVVQFYLQGILYEQ